MRKVSTLALLWLAAAMTATKPSRRRYPENRYRGADQRRRCRGRAL